LAKAISTVLNHNIERYDFMQTNFALLGNRTQSQLSVAEAGISSVWIRVLTLEFGVCIWSLCFVLVIFMSRLLSKPVTRENTFRIGVLGSGKGTNFVAIAGAWAAGKIPADIALVLSDIEDSGILARARERGIANRFIPPGKFRTKLDDDAEHAFVQALVEARVDLVVLAGFMRVLKGEFLRAFEGQIVNIHPSLLPSFPGLEAWKQALDHGVKVTGCTVHYVDAGVDSGPIIAQQTVPVLDTDTPETLHERIQQAEYELYPRCIAAIAAGSLRVSGRNVLGMRSVLE
jgi:phosphoribosylglycinamide formyltransferase-1